MKMKNSFVYLLLFAFSFMSFSTLRAQDTGGGGMFKFGLNGAFYGAGDLTGPSFYGEYSHPVNQYIAITPKLFCGTAYSLSDKNELNYSDYRLSQVSSFGASLTATFTPMPLKFNRLHVDLGVLYNNFTSSWTKQSITFVMIDGFESPVPHLSKDNTSYHDNLFGFMGSLSFDVIQTTAINSGVRFDMLTSFNQGSFDCDSMQLGIYMGVKF